MALTNMTFKEVEDHVRSIIDEDEERFTGGSHSETIGYTARITFAVLIHGVRTVVEYDREAAAGLGRGHD